MPANTPKINAAKSSAYNPLALVSSANNGLVFVAPDFQEMVESEKEFVGENKSNGALVHRTPNGVNPLADVNNVCGNTKNGTQIEQYTPMKAITLTIDGVEKRIELYSRIGVKQQKEVSSVLAALAQLNAGEEDYQKVIASKAQQDNQPARKTVKKERAVVGGKAVDDVKKLGALLNIDFSEAELKACQFEHCHKVSFKIGYGGLTADRQFFNTQTKENLGSGSRALNVSMMRIENVIVLLLKKDLCKEISYECQSQNYADSHTLANLSLGFTITTKDNHQIKFSHKFDVSDNRALHQDVASILYMAVTAAIKLSTKRLQSDRENQEQQIINANDQSIPRNRIVVATDFEAGLTQSIQQSRQKSRRLDDDNDHASARRSMVRQAGLFSVGAKVSSGELFSSLGNDDDADNLLFPNARKNN